MDDIIFRPATFTDYSSVMEFSGDLFFGHDILPVMYFKYLDSPHRIMYVAVKHGHAVSIFTSDRYTQKS